MLTGTTSQHDTERIVAPSNCTATPITMRASRQYGAIRLERIERATVPARFHSEAPSPAAFCSVLFDARVGVMDTPLRDAFPDSLSVTAPAGNRHSADDGNVW